MKNSFGNALTVTLFGESHGGGIGAVLDGMSAGVCVDEEFLDVQMEKRKSLLELSTPRKEADRVEILSGVFHGKTTGAPIALLIRNEDEKSEDYEKIAGVARPAHADYTGYCKYNGFNDPRGGGHFSGRITAGLVAAGAIAISALEKKGIKIGTHILSCGGVPDRYFEDLEKDIDALNASNFAVLDGGQSEKMKKAIAKARDEGDSVGGILETAVIGLPVGVGEPWFDSLEGVLSHILFSIPGVKGVEFGDGFALSDMRGSEANGEILWKNGKAEFPNDRMGGILGGISSGAPLMLKIAVKPTPSVKKPQKTVNFVTGEETELTLAGRFDPAIVHRARVVADSCTALVLCDMLLQKYGENYFGEQA